MTAPPTPFHLLRPHHAPLATLAFSQDNRRLIAGDQDGFISITDLMSRRVVYYWKAHENGILGVDEWDGHIISHGRDNLINIYERLPALRGMSLAGGSRPKNTGPSIWKSLPVNSLNFCRFSLARLPPGAKGKGKADEALMAVPNLVDSELADVYHLPSMKRLHASLNFSDGKVQDGKTRSGLLMSLHLRIVRTAKPEGGAVDKGWRVKLAMGFEDGRVEVWALPGNTPDDGVESTIANKKSWERFSDGKEAVGPRLWELEYSQKGHNEAVMAMAVDRDCKLAWTASADHYLCRYDLTRTSDVVKYSTKQVGNASLAISPNERYLAVGGWDGNIRLFSTASGKPLGTLEYHRDTMHALAFPHPAASPAEDAPLAMEDAGRIADDEATKTSVAPDPTETQEIGACDSDDDDGAEEGKERWLVSGGKDTRIALWALKDFRG